MLMMAILTRATAFILVLVAAAATVSCSALPWWQVASSASPAPEPTSGADRFPDILEVELRPLGERIYDVVVTVSSPYDTSQRYADGWRVLDPQGNVIGSHTLLHDHAGEQPFTRTQPGLHIPVDVDEITVEGRDQVNGFGGLTVTIEVPRP
jgi:hypothetical protein